MIPPEKSADFVANLEDVLELSQHPYDPKYPVVNRDEKPMPLIKETRQPLPAQPGKPRRYDSEYERVGTANVFLFTEPLTGWPTVDVRAHRTAIDWAQQLKHLLDACYPHAARLRLVCDNLTTPKVASLYEAFEPQEARRLAHRLECHYRPKHGSWFNIAEIELSVLSKQCLHRRRADFEMVRHETKAWEQERNAKQTGVDWRFTTEDARIKLKRLYPQYQG